MFCTHCGQKLDDSAVICINCGAATKNFNVIQQAQNGVEQKKANVLGIAGFVIGLSSLFGLPFIFAFFGAFGLIIGLGLLITGLTFSLIPVTGIVLSAIGIANAKKYKPSGLATAGLILSILSCLLWLFVSMLGIIVIMP